MEFKFRAIHERTSTTYFNPSHNLPSSPPHSSFFTHQSFRAGMMNPDMGHTHRELPWNPNSYEFQEAMQFQRELEKERIRAEIIAEEIVRRRILEEEVRRELMMEREMGLMRFNGGYVPPLLTNFEHREMFNGGGIGVSPLREIGFRGIKTLPFQRDPVVASASENRIPAPLNGCLQENKVVPASEVAKDKLIILSKSPVSAADLKRKAVTEPDGPTAGLISSGSKKQKTKDDWSCALCRVCATSERGLKEHLQGKKHKTRERGLLTKKTGFGASPLPKKNVRTSLVESCPTSKNNYEKKGAEADNNSAQKTESSVEENKENGEVKVQPAKPLVTPVTATPKKGNLNKAKKVKTPGSQSTPSSRNKNKNKKASGGNGNNVSAITKPKKFRFWCEVCKVGAHSLRVMNEHKGGKRHSMTLSMLNQTGEIKTATASPGKFSTQNVTAGETKEANIFAAEETKRETGGEQVDIKEANIVTTEETEQKPVVEERVETKEGTSINNNNASTTDDNDKKPLQTVCNGEVKVDENKQLGAGNVADL